MKTASDLIKSSTDFQIVKKVHEKTPHLLLHPDKAHLLNQRNIDSKNQQIRECIENIKSIKTDVIEESENIQYEIYMTPDTEKVRLYSQLIEIQKDVNDIMEKIGNYDLVSRLIK